MTIAYLAVTFAYKSEKQSIVDQIKSRLTLADIAADTGIGQGLEAALLPPARAVAGSIAWNCLHVWDGLLGLRARADSHGRRSGIWLDKFESVRCASLLQAMRGVNMTIQAESAGTLAVVSTQCISCNVILACY